MEGMDTSSFFESWSYPEGQDWDPHILFHVEIFALYLLKSILNTGRR